ncbi:MAG: hypothetical protein HKN47_18990 [Pirellulaceae bacterium]|nr:hypothetical protein [Pirellulaceae bacterium]
MTSESISEGRDAEGAGCEPSVSHLGAQWMLARVWAATSVVICILVLTAVFGLFARVNWLADLCANLRVQQVIALVITIVITVIVKRWRFLILELMLLFVHLTWIAPAWMGRSDGASESDLVVMVTNVLTTNQQHELTVRQIADARADVVAVLELNHALAELLQRELESVFPHRLVVPKDSSNFGIALYSRHPMSDAERFELNVPGIESIAATITKDGQQYRLFATHPLPPMGRNGFQRRNDHLQQLAARVADEQNSPGGLPTMVLGDLNVTPWSPHFDDLESVTGLSRAGRGYGLTPTWYAKSHFAMGLILDHVLISGDLQCVSHHVATDVGSDHRAVIVGLALQSK